MVDSIRAADLDKDAHSAISQATELDAQAKRRHDAVKQMGFDSLYEAAVLQTNGPAPVDAPLVLKAGEQAYLSAPVTLARMATRTKYIGGSTGFSIPIGHTGIRYRVGSFHGQPVQQQFLRHLDSGALVLTNQRLAYVGATKAIATPLAKILNVETYNDGLSVAREGRENPDFFLTDAARHIVFLLNWFLGHQAAG